MPKREEVSSLPPSGGFLFIIYNPVCSCDHKNFETLDGIEHRIEMVGNRNHELGMIPF